MTEAREPMTAQEVAARWRVSVWTVSQMTRDGRLAQAVLHRYRRLYLGGAAVVGIVGAFGAATNLAGWLG